MPSGSISLRTIDPPEALGHSCEVRISEVVLFAFFGFTLAYSASSQAEQSNDETREARDRWSECIQLRAKGYGKRSALIDTNEDPAKAPQWKQTQSQEQIENASDAVEMFFDGGKNLVYALVRGSAPSGDHDFVSEYCFRKDGTLAFEFRTFKTVQGLPAVKEERRVWISRGHKRLRDEVKIFDLKTGKQLKRENTNYFHPDSMGWKTLPESPETFTANKFLAQYPKLDR